jgi:hypothetical protein
MSPRATVVVGAAVVAGAAVVSGDAVLLVPQAANSTVEAAAAASSARVREGVIEISFVGG